MPLFSKNFKVIQVCEKCGSKEGLFYQIKGEWIILCKKCFADNDT